MKTIYVFFVCFLAVALARTAEEDAREDAEEEEVIDQCKKELGISESTVIALSPNDVVNEERGCLYSCLFKKHGLINEDGTYNKTALIDWTLTTKRDAVKSAIEECEKAAKPNDGCKLASCLINTVRAKLESQGGNDGKANSFF